MPEHLANLPGIGEPLTVGDVESLRVRNMLENLNAIVAVQVGRSNNANAMGERERDAENPTMVRRSDTR